MNIRKWEVAPLNKERAAKLSEEYDLPSSLGILLDIRGIHTREAIEGLFQGEALADPYQMRDMDKAVARIRRAVEDFEKIAVYGDYDADGVTATAMLFSYLQAMGADVLYYIPQREGEGYGMNRGAVEALHQQGVNLIVTVDNGISSIEEVALAGELGMDVVVTDHHRPHERLPQAAAVVDAHRADDESPFRELSGAGVVLKLLIALEDGDAGQVVSEYGDLAALGTIGDVVPVLGENRAIVQAGLRLLEKGGRLGLDALLAQCGKQTGLTATSLAFSVIPCINATGRMGAPERAVRLLTCEEEDTAQSMAAEIAEDNQRRRQIERAISGEVMAAVEADPSLRYARVIVVSGKGWHHGVVGIVAARVTERYGKPCFVISVNSGEARGSGRSVEGFSLFEAVSHCAELLTRFGGHPMAAGASMAPENVDAFREKINEYAKDACPFMPAQTLRLDCKLRPGILSPALPRSLAPLEPFGSGNPQPLFGLYGMELREVLPVGGGEHLRLLFSREEMTVRCMRFRVKPEEFPYAPGDLLDLAVALEAREYRGEEQLSIVIKDMKPAGLETADCIKSLRLYERLRCGEPLLQEEKASLAPDRKKLAALYRHLGGRKGRPAGPLTLLRALGEPESGLGKLLVSLDMLEERGLIIRQKKGEALHIALAPAKEKVDIFASPLYQRLAGPEL